MKNWVLSRVIPSCSACCNLYLLIALCCFTWLGCGSSSQLTKDEKLVSQYQRAIGCSDYARLRPAAGDHEDVLAACKDRLQGSFAEAEVVTAFVYRSLNKGVLFVHLVFRGNPGEARQGYNYLVRQEEAEVLGGYLCGTV